MEDEIKCCACGKNVILKFNKIGWTEHGRLWECPSCGYTSSIGHGHVELGGTAEKLRIMTDAYRAVAEDRDKLAEKVRKLSLEIERLRGLQ